jgi:hypothetical protein
LWLRLSTLLWLRLNTLAAAAVAGHAVAAEPAACSGSAFYEGRARNLLDQF